MLFSACYFAVFVILVNFIVAITILDSYEDASEYDKTRNHHDDNNDSCAYFRLFKTITVTAVIIVCVAIITLLSRVDYTVATS